MLKIDPKLVDAGRRLAAEHRKLEQERHRLLRELRGLPPADRSRPEVRDMLRDLSEAV